MKRETSFFQSYPEQPNIKPVACEKKFVHGQCYELLAYYQFVGPDGQTKHFIDIGFQYDGASVPRIVWTITGITPDGLHRAATLIHDYLYINHSGYSYTRKQVDQLFKAQMIANGVPARTANLMYRFVRLLGWIPSRGKWGKS
jgi:hypothetical protein